MLRGRQEDNKFYVDEFNLLRISCQYNFSFLLSFPNILNLPRFFELLLV